MDWRQKDSIRSQLAEWVNHFDWDMWFTGTFEQENNMGYRDTIKTLKAHDRFVDDLGRKFNCKNIGYVVAVERHFNGGFCHVHSLLNGIAGLTYRQVGETWRERYGRERVEGYDKTKGAHYYLTKYVLKDLYDWRIKLNKQNEDILKRLKH